MPEVLRVIDAGAVSAVRSQSLWHGLAAAMPANAPATLSLCRPSEPYVGLGYHRSLAEIDLQRCRQLGLPVLRRQIGGGPVYVDSDQLFFQLTLPARRAPARVDRLYATLLAPAVAAFRGLGLAGAGLSGINDIAVGDRRLSGTGAGRIGEAVTVVGNVIFRFPHRRMCEILAVPTPWMRGWCLELMGRHVSSLAAEGLGGVGFETAAAALRRAYAEGLGLEPVADRPSAAEEAEIGRWDRRIASAPWLAGAPPARGGFRRVKISADAWVYSAASDGWRVEAAFAGRRVVAARLRAAELNGLGGRLERALVGAEAEPRALERRLVPFGAAGSRVLSMLHDGLAAH